MLTKKDLEQIDAIFRKRLEIDVHTLVKAEVRDVITEEVPKIVRSEAREVVISAFQDFYENIFEPHVLQSTSQHQEIVKEIVALKQEVKGLKSETGEIKEFIKDHEKRITHLETVSSL